MEESAAKRTKTALLNEIESIEKTLDDLEEQQARITVTLERTVLSERELQAIRDYAAEVRQGLDIVNTSFPERRWLIEKLDVRATLTIENGQKIAYVQCRLGEEQPKRLTIDTHKIERWIEQIAHFQFWVDNLKVAGGRVAGCRLQVAGVQKAI